MNWNILVAGGKERKIDSLSRGDWKGSSQSSYELQISIVVEFIWNDKAIEGERPVYETKETQVTKSRAEHVEFCLNNNEDHLGRLNTN